MRKTLQKKVTIIIPGAVGQTSKTETFDLPHGFIARAVAYYSSDTKTSNNLVSLGLKDDESVDIIPAVNIDNWVQRAGGSYMDSMKPLNIDAGGKQYSLTLSTDFAVPAEIKVEVNFIYDNSK